MDHVYCGKCRSAWGWGFSCTPRAVVSGLSGIQDAGAEELAAGAAMHGPPDGLGAIDLPFGGAHGPGQVEDRLHDWTVPPYAGREFGKRRFGRVVGHASQAFPVLVAQQQVQPLSHLRQ